MERVREEHIHFVVIRERPANPDVNYVTSDFEGGAREAVTHLVRLGHRRIGHISGHRDATSAMLRLSGYRQALIAGGIEPDEALVRGGRLSEESAAQAMRELIELSEPPTAVFVANDLMAVAAMEVIRDHGLRVPADIAVVGFGNWYWSEAIGLTTVDENPHEMGQQAGKRLFELLENPDLPPKKIVVPTQLVVRASCGARRDFVPLVTAADVP
jgi:LacI family transcriptional regulator